MAETAANFLYTVQNRPSLFEVLAQKALGEILYPVFHKVALYCSKKSPKKFWFLDYYCDETFSVLEGFLQIYYIHYYDSSFSENFYGLKRILSDGKPLTYYEKGLSVAILLAVPYLRRKFSNKIQIYEIQNAEGSLRDNFTGNSKRLFIISHKVVSVFWGLVMLNNYLRYMGGDTEFQDLYLRALSVKLTYSDQEPVSSFWSLMFKGQLSFRKLDFGIMRTAVRTVLESAAFFLNAFQIWRGHNPHVVLERLPKIEPPLKHPKAAEYKGKCPICLQRWLIPTVLPVSGYVFCFKCIIRYLHENRKCPVTNLPARPLDLVRIFSPFYL